MNPLARDTEACRRLARGAWFAALIVYLGLLFLSLGYFGPYWAFLYWSAVAIPIFLFTWYWLYRARGSIPVRLIALVLAAWGGALLLIWRGNITDGATALFWIAFAATGALPFLITWALLREVDSSVSDTKAAA